jgi:hypothetical protein
VVDLSRTWSLGDDDECEVCGSSYNEVIFNDWEDDGEYTLLTSIGCYSGQSYTIDEVDKLIDDIKHFELFDEIMEQGIRETLDKFKEQYPNWKDVFTE